MMIGLFKGRIMTNEKFRPLLEVACDDITKLNHPAYCSIKIDGCFSRNALVTTNLGLIPIGEIVDKRLKVKALSYNEETKSLEFKRVVNYFNNGAKTGLSFKGSKVTENHKFYTKDGWVEYGKTDHVSVLDNSYAQSILTGMLLGDSCPSVEKRYDAYAIRLTWAVSEGDESFGDLKAGLFSRIGNVSKSKRVSGFGSRMLAYTTTPLNQKGFEFWHLHDMDFNNLSSFCKRKKKLETKDLKYFDDISLALWYFDDGSFSYNNGNKETPRITFSIPRYSEESWVTFKQLFRTKYAVEPHISRYGKDVKMSFTSADSVYLLYRMARVASGMLPRKFPEDLRFGVIPEPINPISLKYEGFVKERTNKGVGFMAYDIEVEDNHNYFCNGTLV